MSLIDDIKAARKAVDKLNAYCDGLPKNCEPNRKYLELNSKADKAIKKLPPEYRSRLAMDLSRLLVK